MLTRDELLDHDQPGFWEATAFARELGLRLDPRSVGEGRRLAHAS